MINYLKTRSKILMFSLPALALFFSCTDLEIEPTDSLLATNFEGIATAEEAASQVSAMYNSINTFIGDQANLYALSEVTTDEMLVPTRGSDWGDNGIWRQLHQHSWTPDHQYITTVWNQWNELQLVASEVLDPRSASSPDSRAAASFFRALAVYVILDNFGQVPIRDTEAPPLADPEVLTGEDAIAFIVSDLNDAIAGLPALGPSGAENVNVSQAAARYLLAKTHLNRHILNGTRTVDPADMTIVISLVDEIEADGYALEEGFFDIFRDTPDNETIWWINTSVGNRIWNGLHYNLVTPEQSGGWNGFATLSEFYDLFEGPESNVEGGGQEERRGAVPLQGLPAGTDGTVDDDGDGIADGTHIGFGFLKGQQYGPTGTALKERGGDPLDFTREFVSSVDGQPSLLDNNEITGIRVLKYNPRYGATTTHEIFFRYSDAHLMRAEAIQRGGSGGAKTALAYVNDLRSLRGATTLGSLSDQDLIDERGRELYIEFWRRSDLIRFGQYTRDWEFKDPAAVGNSDRELFPIPATQIILNPNLVQNPGY
ncbi:RagB/SusD family nutrient uptake outer membrane protein [Eudoraea adriatica]|uniref:RagB/SusD family nutrient uptake outer membrane protein n=1 Tax=Eudoraea adriatica TaxID=446681 RepID=UPI000364CD19|nr:RagB/SusD family nutrient uptake outer membrane protein [Eudoraea adriatica]